MNGAGSMRYPQRVLPTGDARRIAPARDQGPRPLRSGYNALSQSTRNDRRDNARRSPSAESPPRMATALLPDGALGRRSSPGFPSADRAPSAQAILREAAASRRGAPRRRREPLALVLGDGACRCRLAGAVSLWRPTRRDPVGTSWRARAPARCRRSSRVFLRRPTDPERASTGLHSPPTDARELLAARVPDRLRTSSVCTPMVRRPRRAALFAPLARRRTRSHGGGAPARRRIERFRPGRLYALPNTTAAWNNPQPVKLQPAPGDAAACAGLAPSARWDIFTAVLPQAGPSPLNPPGDCAWWRGPFEPSGDTRRSSPLLRRRRASPSASTAPALA